MLPDDLGLGVMGWGRVCAVGLDSAVCGLSLRLRADLCPQCGHETKRVPSGWVPVVRSGDTACRQKGACKAPHASRVSDVRGRSLGTWHLDRGDAYLT